MPRDLLNPNFRFVGLKILNGTRICLTTACLVGALLCFCICVYARVRPSPQNQTPPGKELKLGETIERQIGGGQSHSYKIRVVAGHYLHVVVQQRSADVVVTLMSADGKKMLEVDNPNGDFGPERLRTIVDAEGEYLIEVHPFKADAVAGAYEIKLQELRSATEQDKLRIAKLAAAAEARNVASELRNKRGDDAAKAAIEAYKRALILWRDGGDPYWQASSINAIGDLYYGLNQMQQAIESFNQALQLRELFIDRSLEGSILQNLAFAYARLQDNTKTLEFFQQAEVVLAAAGNRAGVADSLHNLGDTYYRLGKLQEASDSYNRALVLTRDLGNRNVESTLLNNIGLVNRALGDNEKALQSYNQSLTIKNALDDKSGRATVLKNLGDLYFTQQEFAKALDAYTQALALRRAVGGDIIQILNSIGLIYVTIGEARKGLESFNEVLPLLKENGDRQGEAQVLNSIAVAYDNLGEKQKALDLFNQALSLLRALGNRGGEATCYNNIGQTYYGLGDQTNALDFFNRALPMLKELGDQRGYAKVLNNIGGSYVALAEYSKALEYFKQALPILIAISDRYGEASTLNNIATAYQNLGDNAAALDYYNKTLPLLQSLGDRNHEAVLLTNIGTVYLAFRETSKALVYLNRALPVLRELGNRAGEASALLNLGHAYHFLNDPRSALESVNRALLILVEIGDRRGEAEARNSIGFLYDTTGERQKALEFYSEALKLWRAVGDRSGESITLGNTAGTYFLLGQKEKSAEAFREALPIATAVGNRRFEATTLSNLMWVWKEDNPALAIFFGKQAVNVLQQLRGNIKGLETQSQKSFLNSVSDSYRTLVNLLISKGRLPEAQQILGMLKEEEYFDFVRRDASEVAALSQRADLTAQEQKVFADYARIAENINAIGVKQSVLKAKLKALPEGSTLPPAEQAEYDRLTADLDTANKAFALFLNRLTGEFTKAQQTDIRENRGLQRELQEWGAGTVSLYTIVGEDRYRVILTTANTQVDGKTEIRAAELNKKVLAFSEAIQNPRVDPRPLAQELYNILIKPIEKQLADADAKTLVWSLDGTLRYLPLAALFDGHQYMVEKYQQVIITLASRTRLSETVNRNWRGLGLGVSEAKEVSLPGSGQRFGFSPLPDVPAELQAVIREETPSAGTTLRESGVLPGRRMLNKDFTSRSFSDALGRHYSLVHIASHFSFRPGDADQSFLLLGDGASLTLETVRGADEFNFKGVELLTLSACNTGVGTIGADGREVEGFGAVAQERGAKAVLATLWPVADASTRDLMTRFYRVYVTTPDTSKAEALRRAQVSLLRGGDVDVSSNGERRSSQPISTQASAELPAYKTDPRAPFSHPYYWAPFILIGNWR